jgi:predicted nucleic acid-binding protein
MRRSQAFSAIRVVRGKLASTRALTALADFVALPIERFPQTALLPRAFEPRANASVHDALFLALAEALDACLLARDRRLAAVPGLPARVEVIA